MHKILMQGFFGSGLRSWAEVNQNLARAFLKQGHQVHIVSTNQYENFPDDLVPCIRAVSNILPYSIITPLIDNDYSSCVVYTAPPNWKSYLQYSKKNRFGIWAYEWENLPITFAQQHTYVDKILAPSEFCRQGFIKSGTPENKVITVHHGINIENYKTTEKYPLKSKKKCKILINVQSAHLRKNIKNIFEVYGQAFNIFDNVCLVAKISLKKPTQQFEVDVNKIIIDFKNKYPNHAELEIITEFIPNIATLYNAIDIHFSLSRCEGFGLPMLEAILMKKVNICPRYSGFLDFCDTNNSVFIEGKIVRSPAQSQYWNSNQKNTEFDSYLNDAVQKLKYVVHKLNNYGPLPEQIKLDTSSLLEKYSWDVIGKQIINLME